MDNVEERRLPPKTTTGRLPLPDLPAYTGLDARVHAHALVDENRKEPEENPCGEARFQILDLSPATPHIWRSVSRDFGADTASRGLFVHTEARLSTDNRELCTGRRLCQGLSCFFTSLNVAVLMGERRQLKILDWSAKVLLLPAEENFRTPNQEI